MKISVITPSIRPELLGIVSKCLDRQTEKDFEWLIGSREKMFDDIDPIIRHNSSYRFITEPNKRDGDYYNLNKCWNRLFSQAKGDLIVSIVDGLWFPPDMLEKLLNHYEANPKACVGAIGHQYLQTENGKPEHLVWRDPRVRTDFGTFYEISPRDLELCIASLPRAGIVDAGGVDEEFDKYAALSEKEMCFRMEKLGYKFYLDQSLEYRAIYHPRLNSKWDDRYNAGCEYFSECIKQIGEGKRAKLDFIK